MKNTKLDQATFSKFLEGLARYLGREDAAPAEGKTAGARRANEAGA